MVVRAGNGVVEPFPAARVVENVVQIDVYVLLPGLVYELFEIVLRAELWIDLIIVKDIIAVV